MLEATSPKDPSVMAKHETKFQHLARRVLDGLAPMHPNAEVKNVERTLAELNEAPPFPSVPLIVITGGKPALAWATAREALIARAAHQKELVALSSLGRQVVAVKSGHFPQFSEPEVVISAVAEAVKTSVQPTAFGGG
jgi:pimeloyl-ACP methyl ester carboxylesterase